VTIFKNLNFQSLGISCCLGTLKRRGLELEYYITTSYNEANC